MYQLTGVTKLYRMGLDRPTEGTIELDGNAHHQQRHPGHPHPQHGRARSK